MLESLGCLLLLLIVSALIVSLVYLVEYFRDINFRIGELESRNEREDNDKWKSFRENMNKKSESVKK